jgi:hypothetical protein
VEDECFMGKECVWSQVGDIGKKCVRRRVSASERCARRGKFF